MKYEPEGFQDDALFSTGDYYKGSLYGYQTDGDTYVMFYNKEWLENSDENKSFSDKHGYDLKVKNIELVMDLDPGLQLVLGDPQQLEQVFLNIVNNALRAMTTAHQHGRLEVKTRGLENSVRITFADDGPGIPADILHRVFEPFFTTTAPGEGTGLGLSICHGIVQEHGGHIAIESARQGGCVLEVELPLAETGPACDRDFDETATRAA